MWRRLPAYLPNLRLQLQPLSEAQQAIFERTGFLRELVFKTAPSVSKVTLVASTAGQQGSSARGGVHSCRRRRRRSTAGANTRTGLPLRPLLLLCLHSPRSRPSSRACTASTWPRSTR